MAGISSLHAAVGGTSLLILPMLFIQSFQRLSWLSMVGFVSTMVVTATALALVAVDPLRKHMPIQVRAAAPTYNSTKARLKFAVDKLSVTSPYLPSTHVPHAVASYAADVVSRSAMLAVASRQDRIQYHVKVHRVITGCVVTKLTVPIC